MTWKFLVYPNGKDIKRFTVRKEGSKERDEIVAYNFLLIPEKDKKKKKGHIKGSLKRLRV